MKGLVIAFALLFGLVLFPGLGGAEDAEIGASNTVGHITAEVKEIGASKQFLPKPVQNSVIKLPKDEILEWSLADAQIRFIRAESALAIQERTRKQKEILEMWAARHDIINISEWRINIEDGQLIRVNKNP